MKNSKNIQVGFLESNRVAGITIGMNLGGAIGVVVGGTMLLVSGSSPVFAIGSFLLFTAIFAAFGGFTGFLFDIDFRERNVSLVTDIERAKSDRRQRTKTQPLGLPHHHPRLP